MQPNPASSSRNPDSRTPDAAVQPHPTAQGLSPVPPPAMTAPPLVWSLGGSSEGGPVGEVRILVRLGVPVVLTQLGLMTMGLVDLWMVGRLGPEPLAGVALGDLWVFGTFCISLGITMGLDPIIAQAHGSGDGPRAGRALQRGLALSVLLGAITWVLWEFADPALRLLGQEPFLTEIAGRYCGVQGWSAAPLLAFSALRQYLQGRGMMRPALIAMVLANLFNVGANEILIFGRLGFPALGVEGAGIATSLTRWFLLAILAAWVLGFGLHHGAWTRWRWAHLHPRGFGELLRYGIPIGFQIGAEVWAFQTASLLAGKLGAATLAAHTITLKIASTSFMVPLGIGAAAATRVGNLIGEQRRTQALRAAWTAIGLGAGVMAVSAAILVSLRHVLGRGFTDEPEILALVASALPVAAAFQVFDGVQVTAAGALRGAGRTLITGIAFVIGFYVIALPAGWAFSRRIGLPGIWWGLCLGLALVAIVLCFDLLRRGRRLRRTPSPTNDPPDPRGERAGRTRSPNAER